jgi:predicted transposase YbfD/YdcC
MDNGKGVSILEHFQELEDPRVVARCDHKLIDIIAIAICGVICSADTWEDIEAYGKAKEDWLRTFLELPEGIPSHDTFNRVFRFIDPAKFQECFLSWIQSVSNAMNGSVIAIDGKTVRHSYDSANEKPAIHMISAWAHKNHMVLGQLKVDDKSNEITAIPELLEILDVNGCIVTIDAMGCQKEIAGKIVDGGGDYVLAVKGNQGTLYDDIKLYFDNMEKCKSEYDFHRKVEKGHGRIETREHWITSDVEWLDPKGKWKNLSSIGMVRSERLVNKEKSAEIRYYITSREFSAEKFGEVVRSHWGIENSLHWVLDMAFREDESRVRKDNAPENLALLRRIALNLLKQEKTKKRGIAGKRRLAGWDNAYLNKILGILMR